MEKGYVLGRVKVLSEASWWQETSLATPQRATCSSHSDPDGSLSRWGSHGVGRDFSDCEDRSGLHWRKLEWPTLHQRSSYAARAAVSASDASRRPHDFLRTNVNRMVWPAISPDLSCIEHVWDVLGRAVSECLEQNSTLQDLRRFLREEWARIPHQTIRKLVYSSSNRVRECRRNNGGFTHYWLLGHFFGRPL